MGFRTKLIISYAGMILLTLMLALALFTFVLQQTQQGERAKVELRLKQTTEQVASKLPAPRSNLELPNYLGVINIIASTSNVRFLLINESGDVLLDTEQSKTGAMDGKRINDYKLVERNNTVFRGTIMLNNVNNIYFALPGPSFTVINETSGSRGPTVKTDLLLAVPEGQLAFDWGDFLKWLILATILALVASILAAFFLARNIARPLIRMTKASEAIARGNYNERLEQVGRGEDEMSRLALSFNRMVEEVAHSQQSMRDFVANVSHELKTPLTSIQGFSQAVLDGTVDTRPMLEHSLTVIYDEAARMRRMVDELLDLSRIESGQIEFHWREIDIRRTLERVIMKLDPLATQKNIHLTANLSAYEAQLNKGTGLLARRNANPTSNNNVGVMKMGPLVWGDSDRLEQVFTNIMDNAIKYSPEGNEVNIELRLAALNDLAVEGQPTAQNAYNWVAISISNAGPLIPPDQLPRIFERFYKVDKSRAKKKGESTGLGLSIAKELIDLHQGIVQVESVTLPTLYEYPYPVAINEGQTTFRVYLPAMALPIALPHKSSYSVVAELGSGNA